MNNKPLISVVIPVYNESAALHQNLPVIIGVLREIRDIEFSLLLVDDGSGDDTVEQLATLLSQEPNMELLCLNRNFGKEAAIHAGLAHARGQAVIVMDSDLQHPPALIPQMITLWQQGLEVVEARKSSRGRESLASALLANGFYRLFHLLSGMDLKNHSDYKLLDRKVVDAYLELPERKRFFRGLVAWMGFPSAQLYFEVPPREHGQSAWSKFKLLRFSMTALSGFSSAPLHLISLLGVICLGLGLAIGGIALHDKFTGEAVSGFTTVILLILVIGSFIMFGLGLLGLYLEQIFDEIKRRPTYLINRHKSCLKQDSQDDRLA